MKINEKYIGHLLAFICVLVWGTTFISSKVILNTGVEPILVAFFRFSVAYITLTFMSKGHIKWSGWKQETVYMAAGITGVALYFFAENSALSYTSAANVSVIISATPFLTGIVSWLLFKGEKISPKFVIGFILAVGGICLISYNGAKELSLNPLGDILTVVAALSWAFYCNILNVIAKLEQPIIQTTKRIFFYGLLFFMPSVLFGNVDWSVIELLKQPVVFLNFLYLGCLASAICFIFWALAVNKLGPKTTAQYIYLNPIVTLIASAIFLNEPTNWITYMGVCCTLCGLIIAAQKVK